MKIYQASYHDPSAVFGRMTLHGKESTLHFTILKWHTWDDFGQTLDTVLVRGLDGEEREIYSQDEGDTFTLELEEPVL
ncbi:MAG: hypothetical protein CMI54_00325 [Parcubacteria group bacterium]|nr:hypothetical protein [Parcubacteria group bacterium]|tara:strand:- start:1787 stop:2020 length:234 start_codon:yes stop_codon:yes gene_type:complete